MWLLVALLGNMMLATVGVIDKFILTKSVSKPIVFVFYTTVFVLPFFLLLPFGIKMPTSQFDYVIFAVSGLCFALGLWTMYIGFQKSEISHIGPLIGAAAPFFILFLSRIFLGEKLSAQALLGAFVLIIGSLIISFEKKVNSKGWNLGIAWGILAGFLFAVSHVTAKYAYDVYGFYSGFVLAKLPIGIFGAALLFSPSVQAVFNKKEKTSAEQIKRRNLIFLVAIDIALGVAGSILIQYAIALGSVTLVNALTGVQYALLIVFVALISKFFPKILKEKFNRREIIQKAVAVGVIALGLSLLLI